MTTQPSVWTDKLRPTAGPTLEQNRKCDVAVIGGGLAGILTARFLQDAGVDVLVLEKDTIGAGESGRTTAKITAQHGLIYHTLTQSRGPAVARQYAKAHLDAIDQYETIIRTLPTDCGFQRCPAYLYTGGTGHRLQLEFLAAKQAGIPCALTRKTELPVPVTAALRFDNQARFQPLEFLHAMARGLQIYEHSPVNHVRRGNGGTLLETPGGTVFARSVVFAAHYPLVNVPGWYFTRIHQERSYVIALENAFLPDGMYLGIDPDGLSFRTAGNDLLLGGGGHRTGENPNHPYETLEAQAKTLWPRCRVVRRWSAQDCMTIDSVPYIGPYAPSAPDWFVATGFQKWGMTTSMVAARLITDLILGDTNPNAAVFDPARSVKGSVGNLMREMGHAAKGLTKGLLQGRRCSHMGCRLEWNPAEGTWDCPCHGSRFAPDGSILNNPALEEEHFE
jgi:glycine/D-amino acid oxidase-like deaminating enzyme